MIESLTYRQYRSVDKIKSTLFYLLHCQISSSMAAVCDQMPQRRIRCRARLKTSNLAEVFFLRTLHDLAAVRRHDASLLKRRKRNSSERHEPCLLPHTSKDPTLTGTGGDTSITRTREITRHQDESEEARSNCLPICSPPVSIFLLCVGYAGVI